MEQPMEIEEEGAQKEEAQMQRLYRFLGESRSPEDRSTDPFDSLSSRRFFMHSSVIVAKHANVSKMRFKFNLKTIRFVRFSLR